MPTAIRSFVVECHINVPIAHFSREPLSTSGIQDEKLISSGSEKSKDCNEKIQIH